MINTEALERTSDILSVLEEMEAVTRDLEYLAAHLGLENRGEAQALVSRLKILTEIIVGNTQEFSVISEGASLKSIPTSKIERMGLAREIVRLRHEHKLTHKEIADKYQLSPGTVSRFLDIYDKSSPIERSNIARRSIFDTTERMEDLGATLYRAIARLEASDNENFVRCLSEFRQAIALAEKIKDKHDQREQFQKMTVVVFEILASELPERRARILERFQEVGLGVLSQRQIEASVS